MNWKLLCLAAASLSAPFTNAAIIANWKHDETTGQLIDSTGNHPDGVSTGVPTYLMPGVPNGTYGAINVTSAFGTSLEYGPTATDEFFTVGLNNDNPVLNLDNTEAFTIMAWINPYPLASTTAR